MGLKITETAITSSKYFQTMKNKQLWIGVPTYMSEDFRYDLQEFMKWLST